MNEKQKESFRRFTDAVRRSKAFTDKVKGLIERGKPITEIAELMKPGAEPAPGPEPPSPVPDNDNAKPPQRQGPGRHLGYDPAVADAAFVKEPNASIKDLQRLYRKEPGGGEISPSSAKAARANFRSSGTSAPPRATEPPE
jgi:hypothetical protein